MGHYLLVWSKTMVESKLGKKGQGMVEYALILAFVVVLALALTNTGGIADKIKAVFTNVGSALDKGSAKS